MSQTPDRLVLTADLSVQGGAGAWQAEIALRSRSVMATRSPLDVAVRNVVCVGAANNKELSPKELVLVAASHLPELEEDLETASGLVVVNNRKTIQGVQHGLPLLGEMSIEVALACDKPVFLTGPHPSKWARHRSGAAPVMDEFHQRLQADSRVVATNGNYQQITSFLAKNKGATE